MNAEAGPSNERPSVKPTNCSDDEGEDDDDFQESPFKQKQKLQCKVMPKKKRERTTSPGSSVDHKQSSSLGKKPSKKKQRLESEGAKSPHRKSKAEIKFELANNKREAKRGAKEEQRKERENAKVAEGNKITCSKCKKPGNSRASNKDCVFYSPRRSVTSDLKRTFILKTSLKNTCKFPSFVSALQSVVKHVRNITFAGSLLANYYMLQQLSEHKDIPAYSQTFFYTIFAILAGQGKAASPDIKAIHRRFLIDATSFVPISFQSKGYMTLVSDAAKQYEEIARNHVVANFKTKSIQYFLVRFSDTQDPACLQKSTVAERKAMALYVFDRVAEEESGYSKWPSKVKQTDTRDKMIRDLVDSLDMGPRPITTESLNANPHLYLSWLHKVLKRLEEKIYIQEESPQKFVSTAYVFRKVKETLGKISLSKQLFASLTSAVRAAIRSRSKLNLSNKFKRPLPNDIMQDLSKFISETSISIHQDTFKPMKYTDPKNARRFTLLPVYSLQLRHITLDNQSFSHILREAGLSSRSTVFSNQIAREEYFRLFHMAKIGCPTLESLQTEECVFWDKIRTDGTDVEFMFKKAKRPKPPPPLKPTDLENLLGKAILWGVDPGVSDVFVAADGTCEAPHRVRRVSTREYYSVCGFNRATQKRQEFVAQDQKAKSLIDSIPSLKTADNQAFLAAIQYRFRNYEQLCSFYDRDFRYSKLKLKSYINKQVGTSEIVKCLLGGSKKYTRTTRTESRIKQKARWQGLNANDDHETLKTVIIAFGNGSFSGSMKGKVSAPTSVILKKLKQEARNRKMSAKVVMIDEYLTSQICPKCQTKSLEHKSERPDVDGRKGANIHAVLACKTCRTVWNRDAMAAMNIRAVFFHMAANKNERPLAFRRPKKNEYCQMEEGGVL